MNIKNENKYRYNNQLAALKEIAFLMIFILAIPAMLFMAVALIITGILLIPSAAIFVTPMAIAYIKNYSKKEKQND